MGEIIKEVGKIHIGDDVLRVELNRGNGSEEELIHIQNERIRFECTRSEFNKIGATLLFANDNLASYKMGD